MNQTQHQRWAYRSAGLQALIDNQQHTIKTPSWGSSCAVEATACVERFRGKTELPRERAKKLVCRKTSTGSHIEYKKRELFTRKANTSCMSSSQRK